MVGVKTILAAAILAATQAQAAEIVAQKSDTFIFEGFPQGEYSKSDFIAVAHVAGERAIAYLPFELKTQDMGIQPENDSISDCKLTLYIKSLPLIPESNALATPIEQKPDAREKKLEDQKTLDQSVAEKAEKTVKYVEKKIDAETDTKIVIEVIGVCDAECFEPNSRDFRVSWDGQHDAAAPKHNTMDNRLEEGGLFQLGKIEIDTSTDEYENGDKITVSTPELLEFIRFALGITKAHNQEPTFRSPLSKIEYAAIILRQISGPSGVFFYSADSMGEKTGKDESGDEVEKKFAKNRKGLPETPEQMEETVNDYATESTKVARTGVKAAEESATTSKSRARTATERAVARSKREKKSPLDHIKLSKPLFNDDVELVRDISPDRRPRLELESKREIPVVEEAPQ